MKAVTGRIATIMSRHKPGQRRTPNPGAGELESVAPMQPRSDASIRFDRVLGYTGPIDLAEAQRNGFVLDQDQEG